MSFQLKRDPISGIYTQIEMDTDNKPEQKEIVLQTAKSGVNLNKPKT
jgi:hypothetical protein